MVVVENRGETLDLCYQGCKAEVSYPLDVGDTGSGGYYRAFLLGMGAVDCLWCIVTWHSVGTHLVGHENH